MYLRLRAGRDTEKLRKILKATNELINIGLKALLVEKKALAKFDRKKVILNPGDIVFEETSWDNKRLLARVASELGVELEEIQISNLSASPLTYPTIGVYSGFGVSSKSVKTVVKTLSSVGLFNIAFLTSGSLYSALQGIDVLILPNGDCSLVVEGLGETGASSIKKFIESGGASIGISEGALAFIKEATGNYVPKCEDYSHAASALPMVDGKIISDISQVPQFAVWNYRILDGVVRTSPISGEVLVRARSSILPFLLGLKEVKAWLDAPLFSVSGKAFEVAKVKAIGPKASLGAEYEFSENLVLKASAVVFAPYSFGKLFLFSPDFSHPDFPESHIWLGGAILFSGRKNAEVQMLMHQEATRSEPSHLCLAELFAKSHDLVGQMKNLYNILEVVAHLSLKRCSAQVRMKAFDLLDSLNDITAGLDDFRVDVRTTLEGSQLTTEILNRIAANKNLASRDKSRLDFLRQNFNRVLQENFKLHESSCRAAVAISSFSVTLEKELLEISKELLKPSDSSLDERFMDVLFGISGDAPMYAPWYDGRSGRPETRIAKPDNFGLLPPLLSMMVSYKKAASALKTLNLIISS
ncbi:MAG: hypothetical protein QXF26_00415 [Candidatus Bathyarchaeia archaeon]